MSCDSSKEEISSESVSANLNCACSVKKVSKVLSEILHCVHIIILSIQGWGKRVSM